MNSIIVERLSKLVKYESKHAIIKCNNKEIGKIPLLFLVHFDVFDSVIDFDNIITLPNNLVSEESVIYFIENIKQVLNNSVIMQYSEHFSDIIIICDYLQYSKGLFDNMLCQFGDTSLDISSNDVVKECIGMHSLKGLRPQRNTLNKLSDKNMWILIRKLFTKTGRLYFESQIENRSIISEDINDIMFIFKHIPVNDSKKNIFYKILSKYFNNNKNDPNVHEFTELVCSKMNIYSDINVHVSEISDKHKSDIINRNINSPISKLYSINMNYAKNMIDIIHIYNSQETQGLRSFLKLYSESNKQYINIKLVNKPLFMITMKEMGYLQHISNDSSKYPPIIARGLSKITPHPFVHYYDVYIDESYFTQDWIFVAI